jgi:hypothetical protein
MRAGEIYYGGFRGYWFCTDGLLAFLSLVLLVVFVVCMSLVLSAAMA